MYDERMFEKGIRTTVESLLALDPVVCDRRELDHIVELSARVRGWVDAIDVAVARRVASNATPGVDASPAEVLGRCGRRSARKPRLPPIGPRCATSCRRSKMRSPMARSAPATSTRSPTRPAISTTRPGPSWRRSKPTCLAAASRDTIAEFDKDCRDLARLLAGDGGVGSSTVRSRTRRCDAGSTRSPACGTSTPKSTPKPAPSCGPRSTPSSTPSNNATATPRSHSNASPWSPSSRSSALFRPATATAGPGGLRARRPADAGRWAPRLVASARPQRHPAAGRHDPPAVLRSRHHPDRAGHRRRSARRRARTTSRQPRPAPCVAGDVPHLRPSALRRQLPSTTARSTTSSRGSGSV